MLNHKSEPQKQNNTFAAMALRLAVAAYIAALGYRIITNQDTTMSPVTAAVLGSIMILAALLFCIYIGMRWKAAQKAAKESNGQNHHEKDTQQ